MTSNDLSVETTQRILDIYEEIASIPSPKDARIIKNAEGTESVRKLTKQASISELPSHRSDIYTIESTWTQRDVRRRKIINRSSTDLLTVYNDGLTCKCTNIALGFNAIADTYESRIIVNADDDSRYAIFTTEGDGDNKKRWLRIQSRQDDSQSTIVDLSAAKKHGAVLADPNMGLPKFSPSTGNLLYVADALRENKRFFEEDISLLDEEKSKDIASKLGHYYLDVQSFGEQMVEAVDPRLCIIDTASGIIQTLENIPNGIIPMQPKWLPDEHSIIFIGVCASPYKLGMIYCFNRPTALYRYDLINRVCTCLTDANADICHIWPMVHPTGSCVLFFERPALWTHDGCARLMKLDLKTNQVKILVDIVKTPADERTFPGFYIRGIAPPERPFSADGTRVFFTSQNRAAQDVYSVNIETAEMIKLTNPSGRMHGSWLALDVNDDLMLVTVSAPNRPACLLAAHISNDTKSLSYADEIVWTRLGHQSGTAMSLMISQIQYHVLALRRDTDIARDANKAIFESIYISPKQTEFDAIKSRLGLVVIPHGGPHSASTVAYSMAVALFAQTGLSTLLINYRGSTGYGDGVVDSLPGNCGRLDVDDCQHAVMNCLAFDKRLDPSKVFLFGGSHGGFLGAHLAGQYPSTYAAAVLRNPVLDFGVMYHLSDIKDWVYVEAFGKKFCYNWTPTPEDNANMTRISPFYLTKYIKFPVYLQIGSKDLRVAPHHKTYADLLKANGAEVRTFLYSDNHSLSDSPVEADCVLNALMLFMRLKQQDG